ncbi:hypothetical protein ASPZODRAFT_46486, partial [Penicilliopsis zonata CBS 506.65]
LSALGVTTASPLRRDDRALIWQVTNFATGCSPEACIYTFNIFGAGTTNTPGFSTSCNGTDLQTDYTPCDNGSLQAILTPETYPLWNIKVLHAWTKGEAEYYDLGQVNITETVTNFTIPVTEEYGVA